MTGRNDSQRLKLEKFFDEADVNRDGQLTFAELKRALKKQGYKMSNKQFKKEFARFDMDNDKKVSREEFLVCLGELPGGVHREATLRKMFLAFDNNGDGFIDKREFETVFKEVRGMDGLGKINAADVIKSLDADGNGRISIEEFVEFFTKNAA